MKIAIIGAGYVGLVTGVCLAEVGHEVTCIDVDAKKVALLNAGRSPIYEPGLEELMVENMKEDRLYFTDLYNEGLAGAKVVYLAVGTPPNENGSADLTALREAATAVAKYLTEYTVIVIKSTVPIGTNDEIQQIIRRNLFNDIEFDMVSNPEFLREGTAINDTFHGDRIVIGASNEKAGDIVEGVTKPFNISVFRTSVRSAELIKYASNAFLATKISFINEIANLCERLDANIEEVAQGMGMDKRIGQHFLNAGIGYGGSCFPKDTKALMQIAGNADHEFNLLESVIEVNNKQQVKLIEKALKRFGSLHGLKVAVLGLSFKPNTDDMREAASLTVVTSLIQLGANVTAYDPVSIENARKLLPSKVEYSHSIDEAIKGADCVFILTEWKSIIEFPLDQYVLNMNKPVIFDGRNCFNVTEVLKHNIEYHSIGRPTVYLKENSQLQN
ncbi:MAG: UDP-glucose/GDP-mannose dehydrogenase family protein [Paenibacillus lautus]|jgi:UDPglucose 6-dehydrogenase|uniref:UDP-glucose dehydrogenase family protein n=1 Tax=Paenibacillus lautus TaxID=1401 RepID=UPI0026EF0A7A|nr:UDP-glucose/GDP-mannose dehydrogenase family protein [Paenibacillus lautus]MCI1776639.1 UDP-glucose/GDP-mannose dehydrogenase family protein [Paenibacillus lautus]